MMTARRHRMATACWPENADGSTTGIFVGTLGLPGGKGEIGLSDAQTLGFEIIGGAHADDFELRREDHDGNDATPMVWNLYYVGADSGDFDVAEAARQALELQIGYGEHNVFVTGVDSGGNADATGTEFIGQTGVDVTGDSTDTDARSFAFTGGVPWGRLESVEAVRTTVRLGFEDLGLDVYANDNIADVVLTALPEVGDS